MIGVPFELSHDDNSPLDLVEELAREKKWTVRRSGEDSLDITVPGQKSKYTVSMEWQEEFSALLIACSVPVAMSDAHYELLAQALEQINNNLWLGHFDLSDQGTYPTFRHTLLLRLIPAGVAIDLVEDIIDIAVAECNRFYSAFQLAQAGDIRLHEDLDAAVFETVGEA